MPSRRHDADQSLKPVRYYRSIPTFEVVEVNIPELTWLENNLSDMFTCLHETENILHLGVFVNLDGCYYLGVSCLRY